MEGKKICIESEGVEVHDCISAILVPEKALTEPGYIKTVTAKADAHSKHEFHAMAQMAYYQYQDDELNIVDVAGSIKVTASDIVDELQTGMVIYRDALGEFHVLIHNSLNKKKMLEATNRYCTRWVRLDI